MPPADDPRIRHLRELEERLLQLQDENELLAEREADVTLLGLVAERVYLETDPDAILATALEQASILQDVPVCAAGERDGDALVVRAGYHARSDEPLAGRRLPLPAGLQGEPSAGAVGLSAADCAAAGLSPEVLGGLAPAGALLVPFSCRTMPRGLFLFALEGTGRRLAALAPLLERVAETVAARLENVALLHEVMDLNAALDRKVEERTRDLRASEARLRLALTAAAMTALEWDPATGALSWADGAAALLGAAPATLAAWLEALAPEDRAGLEGAVRQASEAGSRARIELRHGATPARWLELHVGPAAGGGRPAPAAGVLVDVTERHELEEELRRSHRLESVGRLAGGIAHDFNNLLTTILGVAEIVSADLPPGSPHQADLRSILDAGRSAASLTRQLLAFSRNRRLELRPVRLDELCRSFTPMLSRLIGETIEIRLDLDVAAPAVLGDRSQLEQVLLNLAVNARDAMPGGGTLAIEVAREAEGGAPAPGRWVRLSVADSGTGMAPEVAAHAFEPFFTTKGPEAGTGLGLATVYGIVRQHGGHARLRTAPGAGARFDLYLPEAGAEAAAGDVEAAPPPRTRAPRGGETILVVDDEPSIRRVVRAILERLGYRVLEAPGGQEALALLGAAAQPPDALLTDAVMPGMRGRELARAFRARFPGRPVLLMSGYAEDARPGRDDVAAFLVKPLTPDALAHSLRAALDRAPGEPRPPRRDPPAA